MICFSTLGQFFLSSLIKLKKCNSLANYSDFAVSKALFIWYILYYVFYCMPFITTLVSTTKIWFVFLSDYWLFVIVITYILVSVFGVWIVKLRSHQVCDAASLGHWAILLFAISYFLITKSPRTSVDCEFCLKFGENNDWC